MRFESINEVLLVGNDLNGPTPLRADLLEKGFRVNTFANSEEAFATGVGTRTNAVARAIVSSSVGCIELLERLRAEHSHVPLIVVAGNADVECAIEASRMGAYDYIAMPFELHELVGVISKAIAEERVQLTSVDLERTPFRPARLVGSSRVMQKLYKQIGLAAETSATVLIRGSTGTGKELIARAIHEHSRRSREKFIAVNCSAIPDNLLESELFGYECGAFTGARARRIGWFEAANSGTLFLDEVGDLSLTVQVKLLRVLQERSIQRLGGRDNVPLDIRIIAATNRDLEQQMNRGGFRQDCFYRLNTFALRTPDLLEHREDIPELVTHFLGKWQQDQDVHSASIHREAIHFLQEQEWPGNIRQLENIVCASACLARGRTIAVSNVQEALGPIGQRNLNSSQSDALTALLRRASVGQIGDVHARAVEQLERDLFQRAMELARGNQARMARWLGITRTTVREKLRQFGLARNWPELPVLDENSPPHRNVCIDSGSGSPPNL